MMKYRCTPIYRKVVMSDKEKEEMIVKEVQAHLTGKEDD
jgi:hypothetical protein